MVYRRNPGHVAIKLTLDAALLFTKIHQPWRSSHANYMRPNTFYSQPFTHQLRLNTNNTIQMYLKLCKFLRNSPNVCDCLRYICLRFTGFTMIVTEKPQNRWKSKKFVSLPYVQCVMSRHRRRPIGVSSGFIHHVFTFTRYLVSSCYSILLRLLFCSLRKVAC